MGIIRQGANGGFSGKAGSVIGSSWKNKHYIKGLHKKRTKPASQAQLNTEQRLQLLMAFLIPINNFLKIGFGQKHKDRLAPINYAFQLNSRSVFSGLYPDVVLDYSKISIAAGSYYLPGHREIYFENWQLVTTWTVENNQIYASQDDDILFILGYHVEAAEFLTTISLPSRADGTARMDVPTHLTSGTVHMWLFATDRTMAKVSKSSYLGSIEIG